MWRGIKEKYLLPKQTGGTVEDAVENKEQEKEDS